MAKQYANIQPGFDTFAAWVTKTNNLLDDMTNIVVTIAANSTGGITTGNAYINGTLSSPTGAFNTIRGGNVSTNATLTISSNTTIANGYSLTVGNSSVNSVVNAVSISVGNSTVNAVLNSTAVAVKGIYANGTLGTNGHLLYSNGTGLYWAAAPAAAAPTLINQQFTANGTSNSFTVSGGYTANSLLVFVNGVKQNPAVDVTLSSGSTVNLTVIPANGYLVDIFGYKFT